jgi:YVTN family beta-propeller protein
MKTRNVVILTLSLAFASIAVAAVSFELLKKVAIPGTGGWDYLTVDESARRVYISHSTQVDVLDADSLNVVGTIPNTPGVHGIALASEFSRGYVSAGKADSAVVFNLSTLKPLGQIKVGKKPDAIIYEPLTKRIYVMNGDSDDITVLNAKDGAVVGTIALGGGPEFAVSDDKGSVYVNLEEQNETLRIDVNSLQVTARWPLAPCKTPTSLAMDRENRLLFVGCRSRHFAVLNADTGKLVFTAPIGERVDAGAWDPARKLAFVSTGGDGAVYVFHQDSPDSYSLAQKISTAPGAKTMAYDRTTGHIFVPTNQDGSMSLLTFSGK